jgi:hypothetical protein
VWWIVSPQLAENPKVFRIGYRRHIVNPLVNRLWLVPVASESSSSVADFGVIRSEFRDLYDSLGHRRLVVYGLAQVPGHERHGPLADSRNQSDRQL